MMFYLYDDFEKRGEFFEIIGILQLIRYFSHSFSAKAKVKAW